MKKLLSVFMITLLCLSGAYANQTIQKLIQDKTGQQVKVIKEIPLEELKSMKLVILEAGTQQMPFFVSGDNKTLIGTDASFLTENDKLLLTLQKAVQETQIANNRSMSDKLLAQIKGKKYPVITLKSNAKTSKTLYIVSDPNCPYCKDELSHVEDRLKTHNVKMVVVGILHESSLSKASDVYTQIKTAKDNQAKINVLHKIYANTYQSSTKPSAEAQGITEAVRESGITAVPYKFEATE